VVPADAKEGGVEAPAAGTPSRLGNPPAPPPTAAAIRGGTSERGGFSPPRPIRQKTPPYPEAARRAGGEGTVVVKAYVQADGTIGAADVHQSSGDPELDRAALDAIREWRFSPAARAGRAVAAWVLVPVQFKLIR
jgi:protein TonB